MHRIIEFKWKKDSYRLYVNEQPMDARVYPVQRGDEPVMLSPDGRVVPSVVWYAEGGPVKTEKRCYVEETTAVETELDMISKWYVAGDIENEESDYELETTCIGYKPIGMDCLAVIITVATEDEQTDVDTGFTIAKSGDEWKIFYDGAVWGKGKKWSDVTSMMTHIKRHVGEIMMRGPEALKDFIAPYYWEGTNKSKALFDDGEKTELVVQSGYGGFICSFNGFCPEDVFPTLEEAQIEAILRYTMDKYNLSMDNGDKE
jgi:hypothetical protein